MKVMRFKIILMLLLAASLLYAQDFYLNTFGDMDHKAIIYLHGGPGYNSTSFEATTAQKLAEEGYFVIVYDRRGEGRSDQLSAAFNFKETLADLSEIYQQFKLEKSTLIGHSFGGIVATLFAEKYSQKIEEVILLAAPVSMQSIFQTIIDSTEVIYTSKKDSVNLAYIATLKKMDSHSLAFSSYCFMHAMANGFYTPKNPTKEALDLYAIYQQSELSKYAQQMSFTAPKGFWQNEQYTSIDLRDRIKKLIVEGISFRGIYGREDGLFSKEQIKNIAQLIGEEQLFLLDNCAHNPYMDQQKRFLEILDEM